MNSQSALPPARGKLRGKMGQVFLKVALDRKKGRGTRTEYDLGQELRVSSGMSSDILLRYCYSSKGPCLHSEREP